MSKHGGGGRVKDQRKGPKVTAISLSYMSPDIQDMLSTYVEVGKSGNVMRSAM